MTKVIWTDASFVISWQHGFGKTFNILVSGIGLNNTELAEPYVPHRLWKPLYTRTVHPVTEKSHSRHCGLIRFRTCKNRNKWSQKRLN
jgi:hypothetical protein